MRTRLAPLIVVTLVTLVAACGDPGTVDAETGGESSSSSTGDPEPGGTASTTGPGDTGVAATGTDTGSTGDAVDSGESSTGAAPTVVAEDDVVYGSSDTVLVIAASDGVLANDTSPAGAPSITSVSPQTEAGGAVEVDPDGGFTYTPTAGFWGEDAFTYEISDGVGSDEARVTIWVAPHSMGLSALLERGAFVLHAAQAYTGLGAAIGTAGDVNADGFADLLVGADNMNDGAGGAFVVFGGAAVDSGPSDTVGDELHGFRVLGSTGEHAGASVDGVGDANGDGLADVVIAGDSYAPGVQHSPLAYVAFGKVDEQDVATEDVLAGEGGFAIVGAGLGDDDQIIVAGAGDIDGDGHGDILIGRHTPYAALSAARVYVVFGKSDGDVVDLDDVAAGDGGFLIEAEPPVGFADIAIDGSGDVDGDGLGDVVIGAFAALPPGQTAFSGRAYVVFGKPDGTPVQLTDVVEGSGGFTIDGVTGDALGVHVCAVGDVDGDALADVAISAPNRSDFGLAGRGATLVVYGKADGSTVQSSDIVAGDGGFAILGAEAGAHLGSDALAAVGDFDGDGHRDFLPVADDESVGAYGGRSAFVTYGRDGTEPIILGGAGDGTVGFGLGNDLAGAQGLRVAELGDFDGDGLDDVAVASRFDEGPGVFGRVYVMYGVRTDPDAP